MLGERQMKIFPWGKLPACRFLNSRRLEAYATVRNELPLALEPFMPIGCRDSRLEPRRDVAEYAGESGFPKSDGYRDSDRRPHAAASRCSRCESTGSSAQYGLVEKSGIKRQ
jgi:hypothetical protein